MSPPGSGGGHTSVPPRILQNLKSGGGHTGIGRGGGGVSRISKAEGIFMIVLAGMFDFFQFILTLIPFVGWLLSPLVSFFAWGIFGLWLWHKGINLWNTERALGTLGAMLGETAPFINAFPWWTARIFVTVSHEWRRGGGPTH